jgi:hypothetical protein
MALTIPLVNGCRHSFASIEIAFDGVVFTGFKEISYNDGLEPGAVRGTSVQKIGRTKGDLTPEASLTCYTEEWKEILAKFGNGFGERVFTIVVAYRENDDADLVTDTIQGCRIKKVERSHSQGTDALEVKLELDVMKILWDGYAMARGLR